MLIGFTEIRRICTSIWKNSVSVRFAFGMNGSSADVARSLETEKAWFRVYSTEGSRP